MPISTRLITTLDPLTPREPLFTSLPEELRIDLTLRALDELTGDHGYLRGRSQEMPVKLAQPVAGLMEYFFNALDDQDYNYDRLDFESLTNLRSKLGMLQLDIAQNGEKQTLRDKLVSALHYDTKTPFFVASDKPEMAEHYKNLLSQVQEDSSNSQSISALSFRNHDPVLKNAGIVLEQLLDFLDQIIQVEDSVFTQILKPSSFKDGPRKFRDYQKLRQYFPLTEPIKSLGALIESTRLDVQEFFINMTDKATRDYIGKQLLNSVRFTGIGKLFDEFVSRRKGSRDDIDLRENFLADFIGLEDWADRKKAFASLRP